MEWGKVYAHWGGVLERFSMEERGEFATALFGAIFDGVMDVSMYSDKVQLAFAFCKKQIEDDLAQNKKRMEASVENGKKGGRISAKNAAKAVNTKDSTENQIYSNDENPNNKQVLEEPKEPRKPSVASRLSENLDAPEKKRKEEKRNNRLQEKQEKEVSASDDDDDVTTDEVAGDGDTADREAELDSGGDPEKDAGFDGFTAEEAVERMREQDEVLTEAEQAGFPANEKTRYRLVEMLGMYGKPMMLESIEACVDHGATSLAYLKSVLVNKASGRDSPPGKGRSARGDPPNGWDMATQILADGR